MATITKTIGTSGRDYSTVTAWEADLDSTAIYSSGDTAKGVLYADSDFDEQVTINGGSTVGLAQILLTCNDKHYGIAGAGVRFLPSTDRTFTLSSTVPTTLEWIEIDGGGSYRQHILVNGTYGKVYNCLVHDFYKSGGCSGIILAPPYPQEARAESNVIYNINNGSGYAGYGIYIDTTEVTYVYNNTIFNCETYGVKRVNTGTAIVSNNISMDAGTASFSGTMTQSYNMSSDPYASGTGSLINKTTADQFLSITGGSEDLHLKFGSDAIGAGVGVGVAGDIDGDTRSSPYDIGADIYEPIQYNESGAGGAVVAGYGDVSTIFAAYGEGGVVAGGESLIFGVQSLDSTGGVVVAGQATLNSLVINETASGGIVTAGSSIITKIVFETAAGGVLIAGQALAPQIFSETGSGGLLVAQPMFANGYEYRLTVQVPAGKVEQDIVHYLGVRLDVLADEFLVEDSHGTILSHELRETTASDTCLFFRADLKADEDNDFLIYFNGGD